MADLSTLEKMARAVEEVLNDFFAVKEQSDDDRLLGERIRDALRSSNPRACDDPPNGWHRFECEYAMRWTKEKVVIPGDYLIAYRMDGTGSWTYYQWRLLAVSVLADGEWRSVDPIEPPKEDGRE